MRERHEDLLLRAAGLAQRPARLLELVLAELDERAVRRPRPGSTAAPVCDSCARVQASSSCASGSSPTTPRIASRRALIDSASFRRGHFRSSMAESLFILVRRMARRSWTGRRSPRGSARRSQREVGGSAADRPRDGARRRRSRLGRLHPAEAQGLARGRDRGARRAPARGDGEARVLDARRAS